MRRHYYPSTIDEIVEYVKEAIADNPEKPFIRAAGRHWALSEAVTDSLYEGRIIETTPGLKRTLFNVIPDALSPPVKTDLLSQSPAVLGRWDETAAYNLYHVEAGIRLYELYARLDDLEAPLPTDSLNSEALRGPWALPTLGGAGGQTIAGAFSTSTHGGDVFHPPIADAVVAMHLVGAGGQQFWIQGAHFSDRVPAPLCDPAAMERLLPKAKIITDDEALAAALVMVGRFGVIYSVILKVVRGYGLTETRVQARWEDAANATSQSGPPDS